MNEVQSDTKITATCPSGHRLRAGTLLIGKSVCCPKCHAEFVFGVNSSIRRENQAVTDTGVMRILGDMPRRVSEAPILSVESEAEKKDRGVTDTGVMRILGDMPRPVSEAPVLPVESETETKNRGITDTGVMRILGNRSQSPQSAQPRQESVALRPCTRCGNQIPETLAVCNHCNCYNGVLPSFMQKIVSNEN